MTTQAPNAKFIINETIFPYIKEWIHNFERDSRSCNLLTPFHSDSLPQKVNYLNHFYNTKRKETCYEQLYFSLLQSLSQRDSNLILIPGSWTKYFADFIEYILLQSNEIRLQQCWSLLNIFGTFFIAEGKVNAMFGYQLSLLFDSQTTNYNGFALETQFLNPFVLTHCHTLEDLNRIPIFEAFFTAPVHLLTTLLGESFVKRHAIGVIDDEADSKFYEVITLIKSSLEFQPQNLNSIFKSLATICILISLSERAEKHSLTSFESLDKDLLFHVAKLLVIRIDYLYSFLESENRKIIVKTGVSNIALVLRVVASLLFENMFTWISSSIRNFQLKITNQRYSRLDIASIPTQHPFPDSKDALSLDELLVNSITDFVYKRIYEMELYIDGITPNNQAFEFTKRNSTISEVFLLSNGGFLDSLSKSSVANYQDVLTCLKKNLESWQILRKLTKADCSQLVTINEESKTLTITHQFGVYTYSLFKIFEFGHFLQENILDVLLHAPGMWNIQYLKLRIESLLSFSNIFLVLHVTELPTSFTHDIQIVRKVVQLCKDPIIKIINFVHFGIVKSDIRDVVELLKTLFRIFKFTISIASLHLLLQALQIDSSKYIISDSVFVIDKLEYEYLKKVVLFVEKRCAATIQRWYRFYKTRKLTIALSKTLMEQSIRDQIRLIETTANPSIKDDPQQSMDLIHEEEQVTMLELDYGSAEEQEELIEQQCAQEIYHNSATPRITESQVVEELETEQDKPEEFIFKPKIFRDVEETQNETYQSQTEESKEDERTETTIQENKNNSESGEISGSAWEAWKKQVNDLCGELQKDDKKSKSSPKSNINSTKKSSGRSRGKSRRK